MSALLGGPPNAAHFELYKRWSKGQWGMIMTGNVQVARDHLTLARDVVVPEYISPETLRPFKRLASIIHGESDPGKLDGGSTKGADAPLAIMQLSHPGRQSPNVLGGRWPFVSPLAPSSIPVGRHRGTACFSRLLYNLAFQTPSSMSLGDIDDVIKAFVRGAHVAVQSGFDGIELHAAHGYLVAQYISRNTNHRSDDYCKPLAFLRHIVSDIRGSGVVPDDFIVGVKLNAADYANDGNDSDQEAVVLEHVTNIASWGKVDYIQVSGGDYEHPDFMTVQSKSQRQGLFAHFSQNAMRVLTSPSLEIPVSAPLQSPPLVLLTGGLRSLPLLSSALAEQRAHLLGLGRTSILYPELPRMLSEARKNGNDTFLAEPPPEPDVHGLGRLMPGQSVQIRARVERAILAFLLRLWILLPFEFPKLVGAGTTMAWYVVMLRRVAAGQDLDYSVGGLSAVFRMWLWLAPDEYIGPNQRDSILDSRIIMGLIGLVIGLAVANFV